MALDQCGKGQLSRLTAAGGEPLEQLAVGESANRALVEERPQMQERVAAVLDRHESSLPVGLPQISRVNAASGLARSRFVAHQTIFRPGSGVPGTPYLIPGVTAGAEPRHRGYYLLLRGPRCGSQMLALRMRSIPSVTRQHVDKD